MNKNVKIAEVTLVNNIPTVSGTFGDALITFEATPFQWGGKMLMKVRADGLDRGTRVAIGIKAKAALRMASLALPAAVLKRPRKTEVVVLAVVEAVAVPDADVSAVLNTVSVQTVPALRAEAKRRGLRGYSDMKKADLVALLAA